MSKSYIDRFINKSVGGKRNTRKKRHKTIKRNRLPPTKPFESEPDNKAGEYTLNVKPILYYFYMDGCYWCEKFEKVWKQLKDNRFLRFRHVILKKINGPKNKKLMKKYNIKTFPTIFLTDPVHKHIPKLEANERDKGSILRYVTKYTDVSKTGIHKNKSSKRKSKRIKYKKTLNHIKNQRGGGRDAYSNREQLEITIQFCTIDGQNDFHKLLINTSKGITLQEIKVLINDELNRYKGNNKSCYPHAFFNIYYSGSDLPNNLAKNHETLLFNDGTLENFIEQVSTTYGDTNLLSRRDEQSEPIKLIASNLRPLLALPPPMTDEARERLRLLRERRRMVPQRRNV
jgi:thioredoxin-related protein